MPTADCLIPTANGTMITAKCYNAETAPKCSNNGDVKLPFGSPPYIGMGFMVRVFPRSRVAAVWGGRPLAGKGWADGWWGVRGRVWLGGRMIRSTLALMLFRHPASWHYIVVATESCACILLLATNQFRSVPPMCRCLG